MRVIKTISSFLGHPLFVALSTIAVGGFLLACYQSQSQEEKELRLNRISLINDLVSYQSDASDALRSMDVLGLILGADGINKERQLELELEREGLVLAAYRSGLALALQLPIHFPNTRALEDCFAIRDRFRTILALGYERLKKIPVEKVYSLDEYNQFDEQVAALYRLLLSLTFSPDSESTHVEKFCSCFS